MSAYSRQRRGRDTRIVGRPNSHRYLLAESIMTEDVQRRAALVVCGWAADNGGAETAAELLDMLGVSR